MSKKKNGYACFLDRYVDEERRKGRSISKRVAAEECSPLWNQMSANDKQKYVDMAKAFNKDREIMKNNMTDRGIPQCYKPETIEVKGVPGNEILYLAAHIRHETALRNYCFYIIHCNYYCRTEDGIYLPAEIALAEFNLQEGIRRTYHTLIDPGKVPLGYAYEVRRVIEEVHGLPFPPHDEGVKNLNQVLTQILNFVQSGSDNEDEYPPLFTIENNIQAGTEILKRLGGDNRHDSPLKLYPIHRMFFWLKNKCTEYCGNEPGFPVLSTAITEIEKDVFRYCGGISCKYHSELPDKFQNCSLSIVQRLVYIICDHCCCHLKIKLVRGKHTHQNFAKKNVVQAYIRSCMSDVTSNPPEESDFGGASTYDPSIIEDDLYQMSLKDFNEEEGLSVKDCVDTDFDSEEIMMKMRGRGKALRSVETKVGLPRP